MVALRYWWKIAFPFGVILAVTAATLIYFFMPRTYTAQVWLSLKESSDYLSTKPKGNDQFIATQKELIRSPIVLELVASDPIVLETPELRTSQDVVPTLMSMLKISQRGHNSEFFTLEFPSSDPVKAAYVVNKVAGEYVEIQRKEETGRTTQLINILQSQLAMSSARLKTQRESIQNRARQLKVKDPFASEVNERTPQLHGLLQSMQNDIVGCEVMIALLNARIQQSNEATKLREKEGKIPVSQLDIDMRMERRSEKLEGLRLTIKELSREIERMENVARNADARRIVEMRRRRTELESDYDEQKTKLRAEIEQEIVREAQLGFEMKHQKLEEELNEQKIKLAGLTQAFNSKVKDSSESVGDTFELEAQKEEYARTDKFHSQLGDKIGELQAEIEAPSRVKIAKSAAQPRFASGSLMKFMIIGAVGGFLAPFLLAIAWEQYLKRVTHRQDLERETGLMVIGEVTSLPSKSRYSDAMGNIASQQLYLFEESVDSLRTFLTTREEGKDLHVIATTSAVSGEGKTSIATQLALSLARSSGSPTLLIDGDMRAPDLHRIFGVDLGPGLVDVLRRETPVGEAIEANVGQNLYLLTSGYLNVSPHGLVSNGEFADLIGKLRTMFRYIVIDTPPVLPASESLHMARTADAALLCVRRDHSRIEQVNEAFSRLRSSGVKMVGGVLNGIPSRQYAYKYGSYGNYGSYSYEGSFKSRSDNPKIAEPEPETEVVNS